MTSCHSVARGNLRKGHAGRLISYLLQLRGNLHHLKKFKKEKAQHQGSGATKSSSAGGRGEGIGVRVARPCWGGPSARGRARPAQTGSRSPRPRPARTAALWAVPGPRPLRCPCPDPPSTDEGRARGAGVRVPQRVEESGPRTPQVCGLPARSFWFLPGQRPSPVTVDPSPRRSRTRRPGLLTATCRAQVPCHLWGNGPLPTPSA